jgi:hypothetical protein
MRKTLTLILHLMLLLVVLSALNSIWIGVANKPRYLSVFPGAVGALYYLTLLTSFASGANCVMIWRKKRWALWLNILIGLWSISLIEIVHGPRNNEWIVLIACATTTVLPFWLWRSGERYSP